MWLLLLFISTLSLADAQAPSTFELMQNEFQSLPEVERSFHLVSENLLAQHDSRAVFVKVYEVITHNIQTMLAQNQFADPQWVETIGLTYANYFRRSFFAYEVYKLSRSWTAPLPSPWWLAFEENGRGDLAVSVQLILSVSAHIQNDLPHALIESGADFSPTCHKDYKKIGAVFGRSFEESWQAVYHFDHKERNSIEQLIGTWLAQNWIAIFRQSAWANGVKLHNAAPSEKAILSTTIEKNTYRSSLGFRSLDFWTR